ncbi:MAG: hypothetical protein KUG78_06625 [Kangiellaceae bacterium]|nr:hypothetical protein [Kangiellaceae bacterium]
MAFLIKNSVVFAVLFNCFLVSCDQNQLPEATKSSNLGLRSLLVKGHQISPIYAPNVSEFFLEVESQQSTITLLATSSLLSMIEINGKPFLAEQTYQLDIGVNVFYIRVIASQEMRGYNLTVKRNF